MDFRIKLPLVLLPKNATVHFLEGLVGGFWVLSVLCKLPLFSEIEDLLLVNLWRLAKG